VLARRPILLDVADRRVQRVQLGNDRADRRGGERNDRVRGPVDRSLVRHDVRPRRAPEEGLLRVLRTRVPTATSSGSGTSSSIRTPRRSSRSTASTDTTPSVLAFASMNRHTAKIAVSLPAKTLRSVEVIRARLGRSRSSVVAEALEAWLRGRTATAEDLRYLEGYGRFPEPAESSVAAAIMETWDDWGSAVSSPPRGKRARRAR
jgi:hypothetical protein